MRISGDHLPSISNLVNNLVYNYIACLALSSQPAMVNVPRDGDPPQEPDHKVFEEFLEKCGFSPIRTAMKGGMPPHWPLRSQKLNRSPRGQRLAIVHTMARAGDASPTPWGFPRERSGTSSGAT
jgi:hypothetical protein